MRRINDKRIPGQATGALDAIRNNWLNNNAWIAALP